MRDFSCFNIDFSAGLRITTFPGFAFRNRESAKTHQGYFATAFKVLVTASIRESIEAFACVFVTPASSATLAMSSALFIIVILIEFLTWPKLDRI